MKLLITGDWHFGLTIGGYDFHGDIVRAARSIIDASEEVDCLIHLGDMFHTSIPKPYVMASVIELIDLLNVPSYFITGNHDVGSGSIVYWEGDKRKFMPTPDALEPLKKIRFRQPTHFIDRPICLDSFMFVPYMTDNFSLFQLGKTAQAAINESFMEAEIAKVKAIFSHLDVDGVEVGSERAVLRGGTLQVFEANKSRPFPIVNGHIHKRQKMGNVLLPGSIVATDFSDVDGSCGYMLLEV